jgi:hypothetical protein
MPKFTIERPIACRSSDSAAMKLKRSKPHVVSLSKTRTGRLYETSGETYVTGIWAGDVPPYSVPGIAVPAHFDETVQRKADMFGSLLELPQEPARPMGLSLHDFQRWQPRAQAAVFKARAVIEERGDLDDRDNPPS